MNTEEIQMNSLSKPGEENHKLCLPWPRFHPFIFIPCWIVIFAGQIGILKAVIVVYFIVCRYYLSTNIIYILNDL